MNKYSYPITINPDNLRKIRSGQITFIELVNTGTVKYDDHNLQLLFCRFKDFTTHADILAYYLQNQKDYKSTREQIMQVYQLVDIPSKPESIVELLDDNNDPESEEESDEEYSIPEGAEIIQVEEYTHRWNGIKKEPMDDFVSDPLPEPVQLGKRKIQLPIEEPPAKTQKYYIYTDCFGRQYELIDSDFAKLTELLDQYKNMQ